LINWKQNIINKTSVKTWNNLLSAEPLLNKVWLGSLRLPGDRRGGLLRFGEELSRQGSKHEHYWSVSSNTIPIQYNNKANTNVSLKKPAPL
jgi:hypothetical protein